MHVRMLSTRRGSPNGVDVRRYEKGQIYYVSESLGQTFVKEGWAEEVQQNEEQEQETKEPASEDKSIEPSEDKEDEEGSDVWDSTMSPREYLDRWPEGPKAALAREALGIEPEDEE